MIISNDAIVETMRIKLDFVVIFGGCLFDIVCQSDSIGYFNHVRFLSAKEKMDNTAFKKRSKTNNNHLPSKATVHEDTTKSKLVFRIIIIFIIIFVINTQEMRARPFNRRNFVTSHFWNFFSSPLMATKKKKKRAESENERKKEACAVLRPV